MTFQVFRTEISEYQDKAFLEKEKKTLEEIPEVKYHIQTPTLNDKDECILISNTHTRFDLMAPELLERTSLIIHPNSGHDNIDENLMKDIKVPIVLGNSIRANAVVEYIIAAIMKQYCPIPNHFHWHENRTWQRRRLRDAKCLLLGHGTIGALLTQSLGPLCDNLYVVDPFSKSQPLNAHFSRELKASMAKELDILILACSLNESSKKIINASFLKEVSEELLIINTSRGAVIDEDDLSDFLTSHPSSFAYLDVFNNEPFPSGFMGQIKNINKTSHIAGVWKDLNSGIISFEEKVLQDYIKEHKTNSLDSFIKKYQELILNSHHF